LHAHPEPLGITYLHVASAGTDATCKYLMRSELSDGPAG
jgi:hypothetical protein